MASSIADSTLLLKKKDIIALKLYANFLRIDVPGRESTWSQVSALNKLANEGEDRAFLNALSNYF